MLLRGAARRSGGGVRRQRNLSAVRIFIEKIKHGGVDSMMLGTWGSNDAGQLMLGDFSDRGVHNELVLPALYDWLSASQKVVQVSAGSSHVLLLTDLGNVFSCGSGADGRLGHGPRVTSLSTPVCIDFFATEFMATGQPVKRVEAGDSCSFAVTNVGAVYSFGSGRSCCLGYGDGMSDQHTPGPIDGLCDQRVEDISCGTKHVLATTDDGACYSWGSAAAGKLGHGSTTLTVLEPCAIAALQAEVVTEVNAGGSHSAAVTATGVVYTWGSGKYGQLGHGASAGTDEPVDLSTPELVDALNVVPVKQVACGANHTVCLSEDGRVYSFGRGHAGQLGVGTVRHAAQPLPALVSSLTHRSVVSLSAAWDDTLAVTSSGKLYSWGGMLQPNSSWGAAAPQCLMELTKHGKVQRASAGRGFGCALVALGSNGAHHDLPMSSPAPFKRGQASSSPGPVPQFAAAVAEVAPSPVPAKRSGSRSRVSGTASTRVPRPSASGPTSSPARSQRSMSKSRAASQSRGATQSSREGGGKSRDLSDTSPAGGTFNSRNRSTRTVSAASSHSVSNGPKETVVQPPVVSMKSSRSGPSGFLQLRVKMTTSTPNTSIHFTMDETDPTSSSPLFTPGECMVWNEPGVYTIKAAAIKRLGHGTSSVVSHVFEIPVEPEGSNCLVAGRGHTHCIVKDRSSFTITVRDHLDRVIDSGGEQLKLSVRGLNANKAVSCRDKKDGTYVISYSVSVSGNYNFDVRLGNGHHVAHSPFTVVATNDALRMDPFKSYCVGAGSKKAVAGGKSQFNIQAADRFGNDLQHGGSLSSIDVVALTSGGAPLVRGLADAVRDIAIDDTGDGKYSVSYIAAGLEQFTLSITSHGHSIQGSPYLVVVTAGVCAGYNCRLAGDGLVGSVAGEKACFTVTAVDMFKNNHLSGGLSMVAVCKREGSDGYDAGNFDEASITDTACHVEDCQNGTYVIGYTLTCAGAYSLHVTESGEQVGSPYSISIASGMTHAPECCLVDSSSIAQLQAQNIAQPILVQLCDFYGNSASSEDPDSELDHLTATLCWTGPNTTPVALPNGYKGAREDVSRRRHLPESVAPFNCDWMCVDTMDENNNITETGSMFAFNLPASQCGQFTVDVCYMGSHISGSPFQYTVTPPALSLDHCTVEGTGCHTALAGQQAFFTITSRDSLDDACYDNKLVFSTSLHSSGARSASTKGLQQIDLNESEAVAVVRGVEEEEEEEEEEEIAKQTLPVNVACVLEDRGDGSYSCSFQTTIAGSYLLDVTCDGQHVSGSPFIVAVNPDPTPDASSSHVVGEGINGAAKGERSYFTIVVNDAYGNQQTQGSDSIRVSFRGTSQPDHRVVDNRDGTYTVDYTAFVSGRYTVLISLGGDPLLGTPRVMQVFTKDQYSVNRARAASSSLTQRQQPSSQRQSVVASAMSRSRLQSSFNAGSSIFPSSSSHKGASFAPSKRGSDEAKALEDVIHSKEQQLKGMAEQLLDVSLSGTARYALDKKLRLLKADVMKSKKRLSGHLGQGWLV